MGIEWERDLARALERARSERKAAFLYFGKDPCPECARLEAEAFGDERVAAALVERVVSVKQLLGVDRDASRRYRPFWTPTLYFLDPGGTALLTWPGLAPPEEMLALLDYGAAQVDVRRGRFGEALARLDGLVETWPGSAFAPEALYWAGNVRYVRDGDRAALDRSREELVARYPESPAARRV